MSQNLLLIFIGGGLGSICRYLTAVYISKYWENAFPVGTFAANVLGCLLIGVFYGLSERNELFSYQWRLLLATGFCGGYTTFSTFAFENLKLFENQQIGLFALYSISSFVLGLCAVWVGMAIVK